jgi:hypothetical protein
VHISHLVGNTRREYSDAKCGTNHFSLTSALLLRKECSGENACGKCLGNDQGNERYGE